MKIKAEINLETRVSNCEFESECMIDDFMINYFRELLNYSFTGFQKVLAVYWGLHLGDFVNHKRRM